MENNFNAILHSKQEGKLKSFFRFYDYILMVFVRYNNSNLASHRKHVRLGLSGLTYFGIIVYFLKKQ